MGLSCVIAEPIPDAEVEKYVHRHGEGYRDVIADALQRATMLPRYNPATFNFDRYVAAIVFQASFQSQAQRGGSVQG